MRSLTVYILLIFIFNRSDEAGTSTSAVTTDLSLSQDGKLFVQFILGYFVQCMLQILYAYIPTK